MRRFIFVRRAFWLVLALNVMMWLVVIGWGMMTQPVAAQNAPLLTGTKSASADVVFESSTIDYTIVVHNVGSDFSEQPVIVDPLDRNLVYVEDSARVEPDPAKTVLTSSQAITFTLWPMLPGDTITLSFKVSVGLQSFVVGNRITNTAFISDGVNPITVTNSVVVTMSDAIPPMAQILVPNNAKLITDDPGTILEIRGVAWYPDTQAYPNHPYLLPINYESGDPSFKVEWTEVTTAEVERYWLEFSEDRWFTGPETACDEYAPPRTSCWIHVATLSSGTYYYRVRAFDADQNYSRWSNIRSLTIGPGGVLKASSIQAQDQITLQFSMSNSVWVPVPAAAFSYNSDGWWDWAFGTPLPEAEDADYPIRVRAGDMYGNFGEPDTVTITIMNMGANVQTTVTPQRDQVLVAKDAAVVLDFPRGIVNQTTDFVYTPLLTLTDAPPVGMQFAGIAFELTAFRGGTPLPDLVFNVPLPMTIRYQDAAIQGINESGLNLYRWEDGQGWTTRLLGGLERDPGRNQFKVSTPFPARFALFGPPGCLPVDAVTVVGPETGYTGMDYVFAAVVTPTVASLPILYTWTPEPLAGQGTAVATYTCGTTGAVAVTASARNCGTTTPVSATQRVAIAAPPPASAGDAYESDDVCQAASPISTTGAAQRHTFHAPGDMDWISFTAEAGQPYVIAASAPPTSTADVRVEVYDQCGGSMQDGQGNSFAPSVRMMFTPPQAGVLYLRIYNQDAAVYGAAAGYAVTVESAETPGQGALILVAGKLKENDPVQSNMHNVTHQAYVLSLDNGCTDDDIYYLASDTSLPGVDAVATLGRLAYALTTWAKDHVGAEKRLTLYLMDHGGPDVFYMNYFSTAKVTLTPQQLDQWLTELEGDVPGLQTNVIIDACYAGSFIEGVASISRPGRLVMVSTGANALAYATDQGAVFSDKFLNALAQGKRLTAAFDESRAVVRQLHQVQTPWLDVDGDKVPNEVDDTSMGLTHGFACASAPVLDKWPPYIAKAWVQTASDGHVGLWASVTDDQDTEGRGVRQVWATVYPPSYTPPAASEALTRTLVPPVAMVATNAEGLYGSFYPAFSERGTYRIVIQAVDEEGMLADPQTIEVQHGAVAHAVYLPVVIKQ